MDRMRARNYDGEVDERICPLDQKSSERLHVKLNSMLERWLAGCNTGEVRGV